MLLKYLFKSKFQFVEALPARELKATLMFLLIVNLTSKAQTPSDGIMMPNNNICFFLGYENAKFDEYWEGTKLRKNATISTVERQTYAFMVAVGLIKNLNIYAGLPYVSTASSSPNGGKLAGVKGIQDLELAAKYEALNLEGKWGNFRALASLGFSTPLTNYLSDYQPYSLGLGAPQISYRGLIHHKFPFGGYLRATVSYLWRGYTEVERDYYYNNGSYYTPWMDVPSAWDYSGAFGVFLMKNDALRLEANYSMLRSSSGDDIRPYNASQPTNKVNSDHVGFLVQYIPHYLQGFGVIAQYRSVLEGRNTGKVDAVSFGLTYQFDYSKNVNHHEQ